MNVRAGCRTLALVMSISACGPMSDPGDASAPVGDSGSRDSDSGPAGFDSGPDSDGGEDAGAVESCEVSSTRVASCGACGSESQACDESGLWMATSACLGQGDCVAGTVETRTAVRCAEEQRICLGDCTYTEWEQTQPPGSCEVGEVRSVADDACPVGLARAQRCSSACEWGTAGDECVDACGSDTPPRTTPEWAREVCVPGGPTVRGTDDDEFRFGPQATVEVSDFYVDVYPVTLRRYQPCVDAGSCAAPEGGYARPGAEFLDYPVQGIERRDAVAFCAWDGGRLLPTSTQWEKSGRGPAPLAPNYPWGDERDCVRVPTNPAPCDAGIPLSPRRYALDPYDAFDSSVASYYGVQMMGFGVYEWTRDASCSPWYGSPDSTEPDPWCSPSETASEKFIVRGSSRDANNALWSWNATTAADTIFTHRAQGFRCLRSP